MARILIGNIKGPQGPQGEQGIPGPTGPAGPQGPLPPLANNGTTEEAGKAALDAAYGKVLRDDVDQLNRDLKSGYFLMQVKTTSIILMVRECNFVSGKCSFLATELFSFKPKWGGGVCQPLILYESVVAATLSYNDGTYTITLQNRLDYTGVAWITAAVFANVS
jgi:hypothetical protein